MAIIIRHTAVWTGSPGLPGYTQFYQEVTGTIAATAQSGAGYIFDFFTALASLIPEEVTVTLDPVYQVVDVASGAVVSEDTVGSAYAAVAGLYTSDWARQFGVLVEWLTGQFINGRRLRGRTYLVPLGGTTATDGTVADATLTTVRGAATALAVGAAEFVVWHRPVAGAGGSISGITSAVVRDKAALLRSRMI